MISSDILKYVEHFVHGHIIAVTSHVTYLCNIKTSFSVDDIRSQDQCVSIGGEPSS